MPEARERRLVILATYSAMGKSETRVAVQSELRAHDLQRSGAADPGALGEARALPRGYLLGERRRVRYPASPGAQPRSCPRETVQQPGPLQRFRRAATVVSLLCRLLRIHSLTAPRGYAVERGVSGPPGSDTGDDADILFDVSAFKVKQQAVLRGRARRLLEAVPGRDRCDLDSRLIVWALRALPVISRLSRAQQGQVARHAWLARYPSKRVLVQQGQKPQLFYICLSGSATVIVRDAHSGAVRPVWFLSNGDKLGEKEIVSGSDWQCTVIIEDRAEFLCLYKEDFEKIFLSGSSRTVNDPDQRAFLSSLTFLEGWPLHILEERPGSCLVSHHARGSVITKDSSKDDWIYIIRSGSCSVLKECRLGHGDNPERHHVHSRGADEDREVATLPGQPTRPRRLRSDAGIGPAPRREPRATEAHRGDPSVETERPRGLPSGPRMPGRLRPVRGTAAAAVVAQEKWRASEVW